MRKKLDDFQLTLKNLMRLLMQTEFLHNNRRIKNSSTKRRKRSAQLNSSLILKTYMLLVSSL